MKTLKEALEFVGDGFDIADDIFDWGNYFGYNEKSNDCYDKVLDFMAEHIEFVKYQKEWYSICKITDFIVKYQKQFDKFLNEVYKKEYTPKYLCEKYDIPRISEDDELFYDIYFEMFSSLINGNFSDNNYELLYKILTE